ncbi:hypothetical protein ACK8P5_17470 [Paenibacillus sp. EC2-1]|uniref:hypothetical protein n=1 Tax=Paenibacillus sp. EC2-1 TaxID=3388665 RepID=UPI003BEF3B42
MIITISKMGRKSLFFLVILFLLMNVGCSNKEEISPEEINNIRLVLKERKEDRDGTRFTLRLQNNSKYTIVQNNVYLSFPIKIENGSKSNDYKIEAKQNKLHIKPGEEVMLTVYTAKEMYEGNNKIDFENPNIEIKGYLDEMTETNLFYKGGGYSAMVDF